MNQSTPILTIRLFDIRLDRDIRTRKLLLLGAKDLAKEHKSKFKKKGLSPKLFHNKDIQYSGIQLGRYQGCPEWTAIGKKPVKALKKWYSIFKQNCGLELTNVEVVRESYTPLFLNYQKRYRIKTLVLSKHLETELEVLNDKFAKLDRLEKYLYGNIQRFFTHIQYEHNKELNFLKVHIHESRQINSTQQVFHNKRKLAFEVTFSCNLRLPQMIRLGQSTALGYGKVTHI